ncbi:ARM repeat-containing protein [Suhomyces tanzawaensis NRRL Y-17324]|uniref:ARM repeat-containing protein n=1 Tax=Suhomyces tanzawaensis NRRL Y-17324 TaxID=984487 RepID=A0A1E4SEV7_9ASCO|nr:ARM repeat-containing protein [Suhomyces tanzawaensis NRRL Y-17324]ODV78054.1 ARM repeat-containing protein [Suhomyces tanzawaensis NRRL Y-17324]
MAVTTKGTKRAAPQSKKDTKKTKVVEKKLPSPPSESEDSESEDELDQSEEIEASSEDELDDLSEDEDDAMAEGKDSENDDEDAEDDEAEDAASKPVDPNKKTSAEQHAEQRKVLAERKLQRKSGIQVQQIKNLWEKLRVAKPAPPKAVRDKLCDEIWELSKDVVLDLVMKHDASRVVQTLIKYSSKTRREAITKALKGNFYLLATSSYGKYLLIKLLHYGSKESRQLIIDELHGNLRKLMRHKEGAYVIEDLFVLYSTQEQKLQMIREFWGSEYAVFKDSGKGKTVLEIIAESSEKKQLIMSNLFGTIKASVEKGSTGFQILHAAMKEYTGILASDLEVHDKQIREFIEVLQEQFAELVHTQEGSDVACTLLSVANAKERKLIIRAMKNHTQELVKNEYGNLVLITLFMTVDDTVLLTKSFSNEIFTKETIASLAKDKWARRPMIYLLKGLDGRFFNPLVKASLAKYEELAYKKTSKKEQEQRRSELAVKAIPLIYQSLLATTESEDPERSFDGILNVNIATQFLTELILTSTDIAEVNDTLRPKLLDVIFEKTVKGDVLEDYHLINKVPFISRSLKSLIQGNEFKWNNETKKLVVVKGEEIPGVGTDFAVRVLDEIMSNDQLTSWVSGQSAFVVVSIYEVLKLGNHKKIKELTKALGKEKKTLKADKDNKGAQLLLELIN